jgi:hypothetical protein
MADSKKFNSEHWWGAIERLAGLFVVFANQRTNSDASVIKIKKDSLEKAKEVYYRNMIDFKRRFYGKKKTDPPNLDVHKVIALYIKAFLDVSPFYTLNLKRGNQNNFTEVQLYPNEYFAMELMNLILISWNDSKTPICMKKNEKEWFIGLLNHFRLDMKKLDILSLASIIYYIEDKYLVTVKLSGENA